jgi:hypothetical protein
VETTAARVKAASDAGLRRKVSLTDPQATWVARPGLGQGVIPIESPRSSSLSLRTRSLTTGATVPYPPMTENFHYEIELIVAIGHGGTNIPVNRSLDHVWGYGVGIDLTRRDLQSGA